MNMMAKRKEIEANLSVGKLQLAAFSDFLQNHDEKLSELLDESINDFHMYLKSRQNGDIIENPEPLLITKFPKKVININYSVNEKENITMDQLLDNKILSKILMTFSRISLEANIIVKKAKFTLKRFLYIDENLLIYEELLKSCQDCYVTICNSLECLFNLRFIIERCSILAEEILKQLGALFMNDMKLSNINLNIHFEVVFASLGKIITQLILFDEILANSNFIKFWVSFKKTLNSVKFKSSDKFDNISDRQLYDLLSSLNYLDLIFTGNLFQIFLEKLMDIKLRITPSVSGMLSNHFQQYIRNKFNSISEDGVFNFFEKYEIEQVIQMNAILVLHHNLFGQLDQKFIKQLIEYNNKHFGIVLNTNIIWKPENFLEKHAQTLMKNHEKYLQDCSRLRQNQLNIKIHNLSKESINYFIQISQWALNLKSSFHNGVENMNLDQSSEFLSLLLQGLRFIGELNYLLKSITNLHLCLHTVMSKRTLNLLCKLIEYIKGVEMLLINENEIISRIICHLMQVAQYRALYILSQIVKRLSSYNDQNLDTLSVIGIAEKCFSGPPTYLRNIIIQLSMSIINSNNRSISAGHYKKLSTIVKDINNLCELQENLKKLSDTSYLFWQQGLISMYLKQIIENRIDFNAFHNIILATDDSYHEMKSLSLTKLKILDSYKNANYDQYKGEIIDRLSAQIEVCLLPMEKVNPFEYNLNDYRDLVTMTPISIDNEYVTIKNHLENYLSAMFYNVVTISSHDWKIYKEMRNLANEKFHLNTIDDNLPIQSIEQNVDVLAIMRNIHTFVSNYLYNMNNQIFIEKSTDNKYINIIGITHVANSLRTHGTGIINTAVNFTYQFLKKKLYVFSQFLYDEQIKSRLLKDLKHFRENKDRLQQMYSYDRADGFNKGIRRLGLMEHGQSYLDLFRQLITQIGNAIGYIRLIRSGSLNTIYNASLYLPKFEKNQNFPKTIMKNGNVNYNSDNEFDNNNNNKDGSRDNYDDNDTDRNNNIKLFHLSDDAIFFKATKDSIMNLNKIITNLSLDALEGTEYFKLLMEAFSSSFRDNKNGHLKNFYLIIPPLTINFIEYILNAREKISKKNNEGAVFCDDGFSIGLIYLLKLLDQISDFNSLDWFKSVKNKFTLELKKIAQSKAEILTATHNKDEKLQQTLSLSEKRINSYQTEFNLLFYNLSSAKIFF